MLRALPAHRRAVAPSSTASLPRITDAFPPLLLASRPRHRTRRSKASSWTSRPSRQNWWTSSTKSTPPRVQARGHHGTCGSSSHSAWGAWGLTRRLSWGPTRRRRWQAVLRLPSPGSADSTLAVVESNHFKQLTHVSLRLRPGHDGAIKQVRLVSSLSNPGPNSADLRLCTALGHSRLGPQIRGGGTPGAAG